MLPHHLELEFITTPELRSLQHELALLGYEDALERALHSNQLKEYPRTGIEHAVKHKLLEIFVDCLMIWSSTPQGSSFWIDRRDELSGKKVDLYAPA